MKYNCRLLIVCLAAISWICSSCSPKVAPVLSDGDWIDLSHAYDSQTPYWPTADGFRLDTVSEGMNEQGFYYSAYSFTSAEHGGTHIDAPIHFAEGRETVDQIPLDKLIGIAAVVDVRDSCADYADYQIGVADLQRWEKENGLLPDGCILLLQTGFSKRWPDRLRYMGTNREGPAAVALLHFPGLHPDAAQWLVDHRNVSAVGIDTPSLDYGRSSSFMTHRILFDKNIPGFENLAQLDRLPSMGAFIVALPMKIKGGSGGPLRIIAKVN